ncbi:MAG: condensin complex protein MksE [Burkholderiaceae bacterium]
MFEQVVQALLTGEFICPVSNHEGFSFLNVQDNQHAVNDYLGKIGLHLAETRHGGAYFAAHNVTGGHERKTAKEVFTDIKQTLRPVVSFLDMVMRAMQSDDFLAVGTPIEVNKLMAAIDANPSFRNDLQTLATQLKVQADGTDRTRLEKVLKSFRDKGYLLLSNPEREIYQITGKIEFIQEVIEFLMEHDAIQDEEEETPAKQGVLV